MKQPKRRTFRLMVLAEGSIRPLRNRTIRLLLITGIIVFTVLANR